MNKNLLAEAILKVTTNDNYTKPAKKASNFMSEQWNYSLYKSNLFEFLDYAKIK